MKKGIVLFLFVISGFASAQEQKSKYPVDFDTNYFKNSPYSRWMRDPFRNPPGFYKTGAEQSAWPKLTSVVIKNEIPLYAYLDGKRYREGEFIDANRFISVIGQNFVIITEGNFDYELVLTETNRNVAGNKAGVK